MNTEHRMAEPIDRGLLARCLPALAAFLLLTSCSALRRPAALPVADPLNAQIEREVAGLAGQMFSLP